VLPDALVARLTEVRSIGVITGAGVSAESGIPTYRGKGGIYDDPVEGDRTVEALTGETLWHDPDRTWRAVGELARSAVGAAPNAAHYAIAEMERKAESFVLLTQNVDGLHQAAGSRNVIDIHGNILEARCMACEAHETLDRERIAGIAQAPKCERCGGTLRPDAVLFGEMLPVHKVARMQEELEARIPDLVIVTGTSALFPYIAAPVLHAARAGHLTVEVNPEPTFLSKSVAHFVQGPAGEILPAIAAALTDRTR
jgi:NAD-dependent deacetylase